MRTSPSGSSSSGSGSSNRNSNDKRKQRTEKSGRKDNRSPPMNMYTRRLYECRWNLMMAQNLSVFFLSLLVSLFWIFKMNAYPYPHTFTHTCTKFSKTIAFRRKTINGSQNEAAIFRRHLSFQFSKGLPSIRIYIFWHASKLILCP